MRLSIIILLNKNNVKVFNSFYCTDLTQKKRPNTVLFTSKYCKNLSNILDKF
jgi:hypothetical protein